MESRHVLRLNDVDGDQLANEFRVLITRPQNGIASNSAIKEQTHVVDDILLTQIGDLL